MTGNHGASATRCSTTVDKAEQPWEQPLEQAERPPSSLRDPLAQWNPGLREWLVIVCCCILAFIVSLDATILVPLLPNLADSLNGSATDTFWAGSAYLLPCAIFQPFIASLSDIFGRRPLLLLSLTLFTVGSIICCISQNFTQFLSGRCVQGIGGAGLICGCIIVTSDFIPLRQRPMYNAIVQLASALGTITGPLIGGLFINTSTWRWAFYINFPFCGIGLPMVLFTIQLHAQRDLIRKRLKTTDWAGAVLFTASSCSFLIGVSWGGLQFAWDSWHTIVPIVLGLLGLVGTWFWEQYLALNPFLRLNLFKSVAASAAYACSFLQGLILFCQLYYIPIYLEAVKNLSPILAGVGLMAISCIFLPSSAFTGALITKTGSLRWAIWSGWTITILATGLMILLDTHTPTYAWVLILMVVGLGHGLNFASLSIYIQATADGGDVGFAAAMYTFTRTFGTCMGVPVGGSIFQNRFESHLTALALPTDIADNAEGYVVELKKLPMSSSQRQDLNRVYAQSFQDVFKVMVGVAALGWLFSLLIRHVSMDRQQGSEHVLRKGRDVEGGD